MAYNIGVANFIRTWCSTWHGVISPCFLGNQIAHNLIKLTIFFKYQVKICKLPNSRTSNLYNQLTKLFFVPNVFSSILIVNFHYWNFFVRICVKLEWRMSCRFNLVHNLYGLGQYLPVCGVNNTIMDLCFINTTFPLTTFRVDVLVNNPTAPHGMFL